MGNPRVFLDISICASPSERLVIELYANVVPKTAENFRALCVGNKGIGRTTGKRLHYKGTVFHRIDPNVGIEGGDFSKQDGTGGESIYGGTFLAEGDLNCRSGPGILMTVNDDSVSCGSLFFIFFRDVYFLEPRRHVVFGRVIEGMETLLKAELEGRDGLVQITDCGEIFKYFVYDKLQSSSVRIEESEAKLQKDNVSKKNGNDREVTSETSSSDPQNSIMSSDELDAELSRLHALFDELWIRRRSSIPHIQKVCVEEPLAGVGNHSKKSESPVFEDENNKECDKELEMEELDIKTVRFQNDVFMSMSESHDTNAEILELKRVVEDLKNQIRECKILKEKVAADKKRPNSTVAWLAIAASAVVVILAGVRNLKVSSL